MDEYNEFYGRVKIEVFTSPTCPHCPRAKSALDQFSKSNSFVKVVETSTGTNKGRKRAELFGVRSVPTLFITGPGTKDRIGFIGVPSQSQLKKMANIALGKESWPNKKNTSILKSIMNIFKRK